MNKLAIVTGGTSGLGYEISKQFLVNNIDVIALYVGDDEKAKKTTAQLSKCGGIQSV